MKQSLNFLLIAFSLLALTACGGGGKKSTSVSPNLVILGGIVGDGGQTGGIYMMGQNTTNGDSFSKKFDGTPIDLSNGIWDFAFVSWDGFNGTDYGHPMEGDVNCGSLVGVPLEGGEIALNVILSTLNCQAPLFGPDQTKVSGGAIKPLAVHSCYGIGGVVFNDPGQCYQSVGQSFQVIMPDTQNGAIVGENIIGECATSGGNPISSNARVPVLNLPVNPPVIIKMYDQASCNGSMEVITLQNGLGQRIQSKIGNRFGYAFIDNEVLISNDPCNFAAGTGATPFQITPTPDPMFYLLCSANQLSYLAGPGNSSDFEVGRDIDFSGTTYTQAVVNGTFFGSLKGRGHAFTSITINANGVSGVGFFKQLDNAFIEDLNFNGINITSTDSENVGGLAGIIADTSGNTQLFGITAQNIGLDLSATTGKNHFGGLVGSATSSSSGMTLEMVQIGMKNVSIHLGSDYLTGIGGIVGGMQGSATGPTYAALRGAHIDNLTITSGATNANGYFIGGAVGLLGNVGGGNGSYAELHSVRADNLSLGTSTNRLTHPGIGGLVGQAFDNTSSLATRILDSSAASGSIYASNMAVGGIVGKSEGAEVSDTISKILIDNNNSIYNGFFTGGIVGQFSLNNITASNQVSKNIFSGTINCTNYCGGILGQYDLGATAPSGASFNFHHNIFTGTVNGTHVLGGHIGKASFGSIGFFIDHSAAYGTLNAAGMNIGGVVGELTGTGTLNFDHNHSDITITNAGSLNNVGGLIGVQDALFLNINRNFVKTSVPAVAGNRGIGCGQTLASPSSSTASLYYPGITASQNSGSDCGITTATNTGNWNFAGVVGATGITEFDWNDYTPSGLLSLQFYNERATISLSETGSALDPIILTTRDQWNAIGDRPPYMTKSYRLGASIDFSGGGAFPTDNFNPIGSSTNPFYGHLQGNNFALNNIDLTDSSGEPTGVFRVLSWNSMAGGAKISHLDIFNQGAMNTLTINNAYITGLNHTGALAGLVTDGGADGHTAIEIEGVHVVNSTVGHTSGATGSLGGLVGSATIINPETEVSDNSFQGSVYTTETINSATMGIGGLFGYVDNNLTTGWARFDYLINYGNVTANNSNSVGGVFGRLTKSGTNNIELRKAINYGNVSGKNDVGGIIGYSDADAAECLCSGGTISAVTSFAGGLVGTFNSGKIASSKTTCPVSASSIVGGLIGRDVNGGGGAIQYNLALAPSVTGTPQSHFIATTGSATYTTNFYSGPSDEVLGGSTKFVTLAQVGEPSETGALNGAEGTFIFNPPAPPVMWYEVLPELIHDEHVY